MTWLRERLTIRIKLQIAFLALGTLVGVVGLFATARIQRIGEALDAIDRLDKEVRRQGHLRTSLLLQVEAEKNFLLSGDPKYLDTHARLRRENEAVIAAALARSDDPEGTKAPYRKTLAEAHEAYEHSFGEVVRMTRDNQTDAAIWHSVTRSSPRAEEMLAASEALHRIDEALVAEQSTEASTVVQQAWTFMLALSAVTILVSLLLGTATSRAITRPVHAMSAFLRDLGAGEGDLTRRLPVESHDEIGQMAQGFNAFVEKLQDIVLQVKRAAEWTGATSQQLAAASQQLSSGAQEQASSLEETAASLEEITATVRQNADSARQANQLAHASRDTADRGRQVVTAAVAAMGEIHHAAEQIADIINVIDDIAFQTNLLALNAAVEAARAGEQGRGFAVVAAEVRSLAQRSATAAKEIKGLIKDSSQKVAGGAELVQTSGKTLEDIVVSVRRVTDIIAEISAASQEQSQGIDQVNRAVAQMDNVTQATAAQTEQVSATSQALATHASQLQTLMARFQMRDAATSIPPPPGASAPFPAPLPVVPPPPAAPIRVADVKHWAAQLDADFEEF